MYESILTHSFTQSGIYFSKVPTFCQKDSLNVIKSDMKHVIVVGILFGPHREKTCLKGF